MKEMSFEDADGVIIHYRHWPTGLDPRGAVVVAHGASEHSGRYGRFAQALNHAGLAVYALDHRGHGATAASTGAGRPGPRGMDGVLDDIARMAEIARTETGPEVILFGHSMGSLFVQAFVERDAAPLAGYILSGSMGPLAEGMDEVLDGLRAAVEAGMGDETLDALAGFNEAFEPARTPYDWLSRDPAEVDQYLEDPLCGDGMPLTYAYASEMLELIRSAMSPAGIAQTPEGLPALLITGGDDPVSNQGAQVRILEEELRRNGVDVSAIYYPGARHELLNETNRDEVTADVLEWIVARLGTA